MEKGLLSHVGVSFVITDIDGRREEYFHSPLPVLSLRWPGLPQAPSETETRELNTLKMIQYLTQSFISTLLSRAMQQEQVCGVGTEDPVPTVGAFQGFTSV